MELWELFESKKDYENRQETLFESLDENHFPDPIPEDHWNCPGCGYEDIDTDDCPECGFESDRNEEHPLDAEFRKHFPPGADEEGLTEGAKMVWRRKGNKVVKGYRCTTGRKKGRLVDTPADCSKTIDLKKRFRMKKMLQQKGTRIRRKALKTKKRNPVSMRLQRMNKANRKKL